ncbi:MAG TPA: AI-2E family transporter [Candidatus Angelobacter sp.]|nr:AI-2E family transporter [Candidatus Angelobacter sp.]
MNGASSTNATTSDRLTTVLSYGVLLLLFYLVFRIYEPFLAALGWAAILAIFFYPLHRRLVRRFSETRAAVLSTLAVTILLIVPAILVTSLFVREAVSISRGVQHSIVEQHAPAIAKAWFWIAHHVPGIDPNADVFDMLEQGIEKQAGFLAERLGTVLRNIAAFIFDLFVMIFAMFYFFRDAGQIMRGVRGILPFDSEHREAMLTQASDLISASVITSLVIAAIQGALGGLGFAIVDLPAPIFWGVAMAFFSLVPVVGSGLIFVPASLWLAFTGHWGRALVLLIICAVVSTVLDNVLRPLLLGGRTELSALVVFISILGGVSLFGMLGLVLGPILVATAASVLNAHMDRTESPPITPA